MGTKRRTGYRLVCCTLLVGLLLLGQTVAWAQAEPLEVSVSYDLGGYDRIVFGKPVKTRITISGGQPPYEIIVVGWSAGDLGGEAASLQETAQPNVYDTHYVFKEGGFAQAGKFVQFSVRVVDAADKVVNYWQSTRDQFKVADGPFSVYDLDESGMGTVWDYDIQGKLLGTTITYMETDRLKVLESYGPQEEWLKTQKFLGDSNMFAYQAEPYTDAQGHSGVYVRDFTSPLPYHFSYKDASGNTVDEFFDGCVFEKGPLAEKRYVDARGQSVVEYYDQGLLEDKHYTDAQGRQVKDHYFDDGRVLRCYQDAAGNTLSEHYDAQGQLYAPWPGNALVDSAIDLRDVETITDYLLAGRVTGPFCLQNADADQQDGINAQDIIRVIEKIVN